VTFPGYSVFFLGTRPGRTRGWIFTVYGSYDVVSPKNGPFGVSTVSEFIWSNIPQNTPKGREWAISSQTGQIQESRYLAKYKDDQHAILGGC